MYHYTYYSYEEWGRGYVGSRTCKCNPEQDIHYLGSFTDKTFRPTNKIILALHNTAEEALLAEHHIMRLYAVHLNPHFANKQLSPFRPRTAKGRKRGKREVEKTKATLKAYYARPENKQKLREQNSGERNGMYGKAPWNKGLKGEAAGAGKKKPADFGAKVAESNRRRGPLSEETKRKISEAQKKRMANPEARARMSEAKRNISDETRRKMSESAKRRRINNKKADGNALL